MKPEDIACLSSVTGLAVVDGVGVLAATSRPDPETDTMVDRIELVRDGHREAFLDSTADHSPRISPDGRHLAFVRRIDGHNQVHVHRLSDRTTRGLATLPLGAEDLVWTPDSAAVIVTARRPAPGRYGTDPAVAPAAEPPRRITTAKWRLNGVGTIFDRPRMLARLDLSGTFEWLDVPDAEWSAPFFGADAVLHAVAALHPGRDTDNRADLHRITGDAVTALTGPEDPVEVIRGTALADGRIALAFREMGPEGRDYAGTNAGIGLVEDGAIRRLTDHEHSDVGAEGELVAIGDQVLARSRHRGAVTLVAVSAEGRTREVLGGAVRVTAHAASGERIVAAVSTTTASAEIHDFSLSAPGPAISVSDAVPFRVLEPVEHVFATRDGGEIHGWSVMPTGEGPHPVILLVHGGPFAQHGPTLFDEAQVLASAGYAVLMCNPRGSAGYGQAHARAILHDLGSVDADDVIDFLDGALAAGLPLDEHRLGIMGGSYGAFLSAWILGHDDRFVGGLLERGWFDPETMVGTSDIGSYYVDAYMGETPQDHARTRPLSYAHRVLCPVLVMHSEEDLRCPIGQSEAYVAARRRHALPVEFVVFPGEDHELSRSGTPRHRVQRFEIILDWWDRVFSGEPSQ